MGNSLSRIIQSWLLLSAWAGLGAVVFLLGIRWASGQSNRKGEYDLVIRNGHIIDGTGSPWYRGDVGIRDGHIAAIGKLSDAKAKQVIDAAGRVVAPGFIDMLGQSELAILQDPYVESKLFQGITTEITGEGDTVAPQNDRTLKDAKQEFEHYGITPDWRTLTQYFARLRKQGIGINLGTYVGATQVRRYVIGDGDRPATPAELDKMKALVAEAMREGALGVSSALQYPPAPYPDITHSLECQFPVPDWDLAYALTEGREVINPRPVDYADIFHLQAPQSVGFITYSEGCNDDVNKIVWSSLGWEPERPILEILRQYSSYFISERLRDDLAQGILNLEENWAGPVLPNGRVETTRQQFQDMESNSTPAELENWRFQMGLYRAYYDAFVRRRLIAETDAEQKALEKLGEIRRMGVRPNPLDVGAQDVEPTSEVNLLVLLDEAEQCLNDPLINPPAQDLRTRVLELGEALFQTIHMQLAVERYQAEAVTRAANLDTLDAPLNDAPWLRERFREIRKLPSYSTRYRAIAGILDRADPGPGGFYDNLGDLACQPHLMRGLGAKRDPEFRNSSLAGRGYPEWGRMTLPVAWKCWAGSMFDAPLEMQYRGLDRERPYKVRVVYSGDRPDVKIRLDCNGSLPIHPLIEKPWPPKPLEFDVPREATRGGHLTLIWHREAGLGGDGRGCQVAEVWLVQQGVF
jgi:hypothetical protein